MFIHAYLLATVAAGATALVATPVLAEIVITQQKAIAGNITPGDQPGFPITLSSSGSYSFGGNIVVSAGKNGIEITAADVTIDLNGFFLAGGGFGAAKSGIIGSKRAATILNGTIIGFGEDGINSDAPFWIIRDMRVINSMGFVAVGCGLSCHIEGSIVAANGAQGVDIDGGAVIGNVIANNGGQGVASGGAGLANNALILNDGNLAGNAASMHPNVCISTVAIGPC